MIRLPLVLRLVLAILLLPVTGAPDFLTVSRSATIKEQPRSDAVVIRHVSVGDELPLVSGAQQNGYYNVSLSGGPASGWIYRTLVRRMPGSVSGGNGEPTPIPGPTGAPATTGNLEVHVIDVGQGDATLIRCPEGTHELLIDSGELNFRYPNSGTQFKQYMVAHQQASNPIEVAISSHPHSDHIGNMAWVLNQYDVRLYVDDGNSSTSGTFTDLETALQAAQIRVGTRYWSAQDSQVPNIDFCPRADVNARVLRPSDFGHENNPNNNSVIVRVDFGDKSFLFVGDAEHEEERFLIEDTSTAPLLDCDFLKVGHHGSETSTTSAFLQAVTPTVASVSCGHRDVGSNIRFMHPRVSTLNRLLSFVGPRNTPAIAIEAFNGDSRIWESVMLNRAVHVTALEGNLVFESDGQTIRRR
jgi:competence protein ComEC